MTSVRDEIVGELVAVGAASSTAANITRYVLGDYLLVAADVHNGDRPSLLDVPDEALAARVPDGLQAAAMTVTLALVRAARAASLGVANPELGLPMAYAARAVLAAANGGRLSAENNTQLSKE